MKFNWAGKDFLRIDK